MGLKPSRRPRFTHDMYDEAARGVFDFDACNLRINKFYKAPIGEEDWSIKHIEPRARSLAHRTTGGAHMHSKASRMVQEQQVKTTRLPIMRPTVQAAPQRFVKNVMTNHYRTQDLLSESSDKAGREVYLSMGAIERARSTVDTWNDAQN